MGKGFDTFMRNPYWRKIYEGAPSKYLREYYRIMFDISPFVEGDDVEDAEAGADADSGADSDADAVSEAEAKAISEADARLRELWISKEELEYLKEHAGMAQAKVFYQKCIDKLEAADEEGLCVSAICLKGEIRNPWYEE